MNTFRRDFLKLAGGGAAAAAAATIFSPGASAAPALAMPGAETSYVFNVKVYGAKGDGKTIDTPAINAAIDAASAAGGGPVPLPSGTYLCYSIRLQSNIALYLENGTTIHAVSSTASNPGYDAAEPNQWDKYQDYGHDHWKNSLIYGIDLKNIAILGGGLIDGTTLMHSTRFGDHHEDAPNAGDKAIALKSCHNVILRDFKILNGGYFGILATGVDNMTIDNLIVDTNRDGRDIDCCKNVRITNCTVNSPRDDGICLKSSFALGHTRATENVKISNCMVSGSYIFGSVIDGTWKKYPADKTEFGRTGRIKCGTESADGFMNITVSNCVFDGCAGMALETADGATGERHLHRHHHARLFDYTYLYAHLPPHACAGGYAHRLDQARYLEQLHQLQLHS
jgi:polygalacturonase